MLPQLHLRWVSVLLAALGWVLLLPGVVLTGQLGALQQWRLRSTHVHMPSGSRLAVLQQGQLVGTRATSGPCLASQPAHLLLQQMEQAACWTQCNSTPAASATGPSRRVK